MKLEKAVKTSLVVLGISAAGFAAWRGGLVKESSAAPAAAAPTAKGPRVVLAEGRLVTYPGKQVVVGTELAGPLQKLLVGEKAVVKKGDLLAEIGVDEQRAALREAYARAKAAAVDVDFAGTELERTAALRASNALPQASLDRATREKNSAAAHREVAGAAAHRLETVIAKAAVKAPIDGVVLVKHAEAGELVTAGAPLVTIADTRALRVEAEVDEFDGSRVAVGQAVSLWAEGYEGRFRGEVEEIPDEVVSRRIRPQDPGRPSDTRVLLVKVRLLDKTPLRLGQRVELEIAPPASSR